MVPNKVFMAVCLSVCWARGPLAAAPTPMPTPGSYCPVATVDTSTLAGKLMMGYQGWFATPGDGSAFNGWWHYGGTPLTTANVGFDPYPDESDLAAAGIPLFAPSMNFQDGSTAYLSSNYNAQTVAMHFKWMQQYNISGAMLQRFTGEISGSCPTCFAFRNQVTQNVMAAALTYGRTWCIMWDVSGDNTNAVVDVENDWAYLVNTLQVTQNSRYLHHKGRPLVVVWGLDTSNNSLPPSAMAALIDYFHNNSNPALQASIMVGVAGWNNSTWGPTALTADIISPWTVGGYALNPAWAYPYTELTADYTGSLVPDTQACAAAGVDYMPVIWPGFSAKNELSNPGAYNEMPRYGGQFYWRQAYNAVAALKAAGLPSMVYNAMFDEVNEGTAMFKCISSTAMLPGSGTFLGLDADGYQVPNDWYLKLAGRVQRMVDGSAPVSMQMPLDPNYPSNAANLYSCAATATYTPGPSASPTCPPSACCPGPASTISSVADTGDQIAGVCTDPSGNVYFSEPYNTLVQEESGGVVHSVLGTAGTCNNLGDGGPATAASICNAGCLRMDSLGNLYVVDFVGYFSQVRVIAPNGVVNTCVNATNNGGFTGDGGPAYYAQLNAPRGIALDASNNLYIADTGNNRIRLVNAATGFISTVAGNGTAGYSGDNGQALSAELNGPYGVAVSGGSLYIADRGNNRVRVVNLSSGVISALAGNGTAGFAGDGAAASAAELSGPQAVAVDGCGHLLVADTGNNRLRQVNLSSGLIATLAGGAAGFSGDGGAASAAQFNAPADLYVNACTGNLYIADQNNSRIRMIAPVCTSTPTSTPVSTATLTPTPSKTATGTMSRTATSSMTGTETGTGTATATGTATKTASPSPTFTGTFSRTLTPTSTPSASPTLSWTGTATASSTTTRTPSPSYTSSATQSRTGTPSVTLSTTPSLTLSQSPSATLSATQSRTATPSVTLSGTPSLTLSQSPSNTPSATQSRTASPSVTLSTTPSLTQSQSPSASPSLTQSRTATTTASDTQTRTGTPSATETTSPTPTLTESATVSQTVTRTITVTGTGTETPEPSVTDTASPGPSPTWTVTISQTVTDTPSQTATDTPSQTVTVTASQTMTVSPSQTLTATPSPTLTLTSSRTVTGTPSPSFTVTPSPSASATISATADNTQTPSPWPSGTATASPTQVPTAAATATAQGGPENGQVQSAQAVPNPQSGPNFVFKVDLSGPAAEINARIYSKGMQLVAQAGFDGAWAEGWNTLTWALPTLPDGVYYVEFDAGDGTQWWKGKIVKLLILR